MKTKNSPKISINKIVKSEKTSVETPKVETPKVETPKVETPKVETPKVAATKTKSSPKAKATPKAKKTSSAITSPELESIKEEKSVKPIAKKTTKPATKKTKTANAMNETTTLASLSISDLDKFLFHEGKHHNAHRFMGAHFSNENGVDGIRFTTWAPNAERICVLGDFSHWYQHDENAMQKISSGGLWSVFIPNVAAGGKYKFAVTNKYSHHMVYKSDPYAISTELRPQTASIIRTNTDYTWQDNAWLEQRSKLNIFEAAMNTYEVHLASWKTKDGHFMSYTELSEELPAYLTEMGYTHVEFMPLHEHPLDKSWGYQATGFYSATSRHGDLIGLKKLVDTLHQHNIGVILDWVPGHFCKDEQGLINFDGGATYEYQDYRKANNKGWGTHNFDLGRNEVRSFLISNALYWINEFHIDGLRVDAVSNIVYLDYDRKHGEWEQNIYGGHENLEAIDFLREFNWTVHHYHQGVMTIAEESSAFPKMTASVHEGGLGFDFKWNMGWMNDTLRYIALDPIYRQHHHSLINFSMHYHYSEKFVLPISHDEVVHGKKSLVNKMWGDLWNKYAGQRLYAAFTIGHPGKKLLFMGNEFAQFVEWREFEPLQWEIIDKFPNHHDMQLFYKKLNHFYTEHPALWDCDYEQEGFKWIESNNASQSILSFVRYSKDKKQSLIFVSNFTPMMYLDYKLGVPEAGSYEEVFNSDSSEFGGSGQIITEKLLSTPEIINGFDQHITLKIPPMATLVLKRID